METMAIGFVVGFLFVYLILIGAAIASYVLQSLALHTLARRRAIANPWLAWIPYGNYWIIGALARDYDRKEKLDRRWDKILLILSIVGITTFFAVYIAMIVFVIIMSIKAESFGADVTDQFMFTTLGGVLIIYIVLIIAAIAMSALQTLLLVCIFKIFESTVPQKAIKYFLLYLLVPFAAPICLFVCRNKGYEYSPPVPDAYIPVNNGYANLQNPTEYTTVITPEEDNNNQ